jgi:hypothetical protein
MPQHRVDLTLQKNKKKNEKKNYVDVSLIRYDDDCTEEQIYIKIMKHSSACWTSPTVLVDTTKLVIRRQLVT